jgi:hypothetical protein
MAQAAIFGQESLGLLVIRTGRRSDKNYKTYLTSLNHLRQRGMIRAYEIYIICNVVGTLRVPLVAF